MATRKVKPTTNSARNLGGGLPTIPNLGRDGWRVMKDRKDDFVLADDADWLRCRTVLACVHISMSEGMSYTPPARALQFADKLRAMAERAAKVQP